MKKIIDTLIVTGLLLALVGPIGLSVWMKSPMMFEFWMIVLGAFIALIAIAVSDIPDTFTSMSFGALVMLLVATGSHRVWFGSGHEWDYFSGPRGEKYIQLHSVGWVVARGSNDVKEIGRGHYLVVKMEQCGTRMYEMTEPESFYPDVGSRVVVNVDGFSECGGPIEAVSVLGSTLAKSFRVIG